MTGNPVPEIPVTTITTTEQAEAIWNSLSDLQQQFIIVRFGCKSDTIAAKEIGTTVQATSNWPEKPLINEYMRWMRRQARDGAIKIIQESMIEAASVLRRALKTRSRITAAKDILDRGGLAPTMRHELSGLNGGAIEVKAVDYRNGITTLAPGSVSDSDTSGEE